MKYLTNKRTSHIRPIEWACIVLTTAGLIVLGIAVYKASEKPIPVINRIMCANSGVCHE